MGDRLESAAVTSAAMNTNLTTQEMTDVKGGFFFSDHALMSDYELTVSKSGDYLNGVSTLDALLIQRHILGLNRFEDPYQVIAADVNGDERISAIDLVVLRSLILGRTDALPGEQSWRFVDANQAFDNPTNPWPLEESLYLERLEASRDHQDFIGVKLGDVNGNAIANSQLVSDNRSVDQVTIALDDRKIAKGQIVQVNIPVDLKENVYGGQLSIRLDRGTWIKGESNLREMSSDQIYITDDGVMNVSWTSLLPTQPGAHLMLTFEASSSGQLSDFIHMNTNRWASQLYYGEELTRADISLTYSIEVEPRFILYQNVPNPFEGSTKIGFEIEKGGQVDFSIFDMTGRQLYAVTGYYGSGRHDIIIDESVLDQKGVLYYQLSFDNKVATRKMISIE